MNYYGKIYRDNFYPNDIKTYIQIIEGIYEANNRQKIRVIGSINITENKFMKFVKIPYDVINIGENTITIKKTHYNPDTLVVYYQDTYTLLSDILIAEGYTHEIITQIINAVNSISNNKLIKTNHNCIGNWINIQI
jgi:hypothetical protein